MYSELFSILISESDDGEIAKACCGSYAQVIGRFHSTSNIDFMIGDIESVETLELDEKFSGWPVKNQCWPAS